MDYYANNTIERERNGFAVTFTKNIKYPKDTEVLTNYGPAKS